MKTIVIALCILSFGCRPKSTELVNPANPANLANQTNEAEPPSQKTGAKTTAERVKETGPSKAEIAWEGLSGMSDEWRGEGTIKIEPDATVLSVEVAGKDRVLFRIPNELERSDCGPDPFPVASQELEAKKSKYRSVRHSSDWWKFVGDDAVAVRFDYDRVVAWFWDTKNSCARAVNLTSHLFRDWKGDRKFLRAGKTDTLLAMKDAKKTFEISMGFEGTENPNYGLPIVHSRDLFPPAGNERVVLSDKGFWIEDARKNKLYRFHTTQEDLYCLEVRATGYQIGDTHMVRMNAKTDCTAGEEFYQQMVSLVWSNDQLRPLKASHNESGSGCTWDYDDSRTEHRVDLGSGALKIVQFYDSGASGGNESVHTKCTNRQECDPGTADVEHDRTSTVYTLEADDAAIELGEGNRWMVEETPGHDGC